MPEQPAKPFHVLIAALVLPGAGHVLQRLTQRGLMFLFFTIILGWVSLRLAPPEWSFFGRHIGGIFIYGMSVLDAYKIARINWEKWKLQRLRTQPTIK